MVSVRRVADGRAMAKEGAESILASGRLHAQVRRGVGALVQVFADVVSVPDEPVQANAVKEAAASGH